MGFGDFRVAALEKLYLNTGLLGFIPPNRRIQNLCRVRFPDFDEYSFALVHVAYHILNSYILFLIPHFFMRMISSKYLLNDGRGGSLGAQRGLEND
jgi:hypothetical protein